MNTSPSMGSVVRTPLGQIIYDAATYPVVTWQIDSYSILTVRAGDKDGPVVGVFSPPWQILPREVVDRNQKGLT